MKEKFCTVWDNVKNPLGVIQIVHGPSTENNHVYRFARFMNKNGYVVCANRNQITKSNDPFDNCTCSEMDMMQQLANKYKLPIFLVGHGLGSYITQRIVNHSNICRACICMMGDVPHNLAWILSRTVLTWLCVQVWGRNAPARLMNWLGRAHPNLRGKSYGFYLSYCHNLLKLNSGDSDAQTPLLVISKWNDLSGLNSRLCNSLMKIYMAHGIENLTVSVYPDETEMANTDLDNPNVLTDILDFINNAPLPPARAK